MRLPTVVSLVIEQMSENFSSALFLRSSIQHSIVQRFFQLGVRQSFYEIDNALIFPLSRYRQRHQIIEDNCT